MKASLLEILYTIPPSIDRNPAMFEIYCRDYWTNIPNILWSCNIQTSANPNEQIDDETNVLVNHAAT